MNPISQKTMEQLYKDTIRKVKYLKDQGFQVVQKWGCELKKDLEEDEELKQFFEQYEIIDPLQHVMHSTGDVRMRRNYSTNVKGIRRLSKY